MSACMMCGAENAQMIREKARPEFVFCTKDCQRDLYSLRTDNGGPDHVIESMISSNEYDQDDIRAAFLGADTCEKCDAPVDLSGCHRGCVNKDLVADVTEPIGKRHGGHHGLSSGKAREILHHGSVHGHPLTDRQRRYFGWVAGGRK